jgi:hypothetical protein
MLRQTPIVKGKPEAVAKPPLTIGVWRGEAVTMSEWVVVEWFPHRRAG